MEIVSSADLTISYDGESVRAGLMDVQELAPALLATSTLLQKSNRLLNGDTVHTNLRVRSDFRRGSFDVHLVVDQGLLEQAKNLLIQHPGIKDAKDLLEILFFYAGLPTGVIGALFKLIKLLKGGKPDEVSVERDGDIVVLAVGNNQKIAVHKNTYNLYNDPEVRRAADQIVAPLNTEGIDTLEIRRGNEVEKVTKDEAAAFEFLELAGELLLDNVSEAWLTIISLSFNPDHKWRFSTGGSTFSANVLDDEFWKRVHAKTITFAEGDQLLVTLRTRTVRDDTGVLRTRYVIERVLKHVNGPKQSRLRLQ